MVQKNSCDSSSTVAAGISRTKKRRMPSLVPNHQVSLLAWS